MTQKTRKEAKKKNYLRTGSVHWEERNDTEKETHREAHVDYFSVARADDDRSVPLGGKCCFELLEAECDGWTWCVSLGVRRYTPKIK